MKTPRLRKLSFLHQFAQLRQSQHNGTQGRWAELWGRPGGSDESIDSSPDLGACPASAGWHLRYRPAPGFLGHDPFMGQDVNFTGSQTTYIKQQQKNYMEWNVKY